MTGKADTRSRRRRERLPANKASNKESAFSRFVVTPIKLITFIVSLALVDRKVADRVFGKSQRSQDRHYHSHQKHLGKQEMVDAFQIQKRVMVLFCLLGGTALALVAFAANRLWQLVF